MSPVDLAIHEEMRAWKLSISIVEIFFSQQGETEEAEKL